MEKSRKKYVGLKPIYIIVLLFVIGLTLGFFIPKVKQNNVKVNQPEEQQKIERKSITVPNVEGKNFKEAKKELEKANLKVEKIEEKSKTLVSGIVMEQEPKYNTVVEEESIIKLYVSVED